MSGADVVTIFERFGFEVVSQRGSHIKLRRVTADRGKQTLVVPNHREIDTGTCRAILRQAERYIPLVELEPLFFAE